MEIPQLALQPANIFFTVFLFLMILYWIMVVLGALDLEFLDIDLDTDSELDIDADGDLEITGGFFEGFLAFFYLGKIPVMIVFSVLAICMWVTSIIANGYLNPSGGMLRGIPIGIGVLVVGPFICKTACMPLARFFMMFKKDYNAPRSVLGRIGRVITTKVLKEELGQIEMSGKGASIVLNVFSEGEDVFVKDDEAVVIKEDKTRGVYLIGPVDLEK